MGRLAAIWRAVRHPVPEEGRRRLAEVWAGLPAALRGPRQMIGRHAMGCAATAGVMPRCDFACTGCYLGGEANRVPAAALDEVRAQLAAIRRHLGPGGHMQLTDGEVTLRDEHELVAILRDARALELVPMLMTHGDALLHRPGFLERLVVEGGLREVSFHVDTTQRGRRDRAFRRAEREEELDPLRDAFAQLVRGLARDTGIALRVASTVTVTPENLVGVPGIVRWFVRNADAFDIVSFQPAAQVGRTVGGLGGGVDTTALWGAIAAGAYGDARAIDRLEQGRVHYGHPDCTRAVSGVVHAAPGREPVFHTIRRAGHARDEAALLGFLERWGGLEFDLDDRPTALARVAGMVGRTPLFFARETLPWFLRQGRRLDARRPLGALLDLARGRARLHALSIVSHHFMSAEELATSDGRERERHCAFRVPFEGRMVSMCAYNAEGARSRAYEELRRNAS